MYPTLWGASTWNLRRRNTLLLMYRSKNRNVQSEVSVNHAGTPVMWSSDLRPAASPKRLIEKWARGKSRQVRTITPSPNPQLPDRDTHSTKQRCLTRPSSSTIPNLRRQKTASYAQHGTTTAAHASSSSPNSLALRWMPWRGIFSRARRNSILFKYS